MPRPKSLTESQIARAALAVIEREGLAALSMRTVAEQLEVGTMSLYRYVDSRAQLEDLVVALVFAAVDVTPPSVRAWEQRASALIARMRDAALKHPAVIPLFVERGHAAGTMLHWIEALLGVLRDAGFSAQGRVVAARALGAYAIGAIQLAHLAPVSKRSENFAGLSKELFPLLLEAGERGRGVTPDEEFRRGLAALLKGLKP